MSESTPGPAGGRSSSPSHDFRTVKQIGQGAFGRALLVERLVEPHAGEMFVIKQINLEMLGDKARREAQQEVQVRGGTRRV